MESIVLHADSAYMVSVDNFVRAICDINHISNYYATILVAVQEAVEHVVAFGKVNQPSDDIQLTFDFCPQGVFFRVRGAKGCFQSDDHSLMRMLADNIELSDDASTLQMSFAIRGIDYREAAKRISVLDHFYHPASASLLQM